MYYQEIIEALNKNNIRYVIIGGLALVLHGVVRLTADLDLIVDFEEKNLKKLLKVLEQLNFKPQLPIDAKKLLEEKTRKKWEIEKNMKAFAFIHKKDDYKLIDIIINPPLSFNEVYKRKQVIQAQKTKINVISFEDLITFKKQAARTQDLKDIEMLLELKKHEKKQ